MDNKRYSAYIKKKINRILDYLVFALRKKKIIINNNHYNWLSIPSPNNCPTQSQTHPSICYIKNTWNSYSLWLATTPYPQGDVRFENPCIYFASTISQPTASKQPVFPTIFNPIVNNPIHQWQGGQSFNSDVALFFSNDILYSLIRENYNGKYIRELKVQQSKNGSEWSVPIHVIGSNEKSRQLISPSIIERNNTLRIYTLNYSGTGRNGNCTGIEIYEGSSLSNPDFKFISAGSFINKDELKIEPWHFDLFEYNSKLYMVLCAFHKSKINFRNKMFTYLAVSEDYSAFKTYKSPLVHTVRNYRPTAYIDENGNFVLLFSVIGDIYKANTDRLIGSTTFKMKELIELLESKE
jgi:hypothetical protein